MATGPTVEVVVLIRATVSLAATARRSMEVTTRALTATLAHITREDTAATAKPSQVEGDTNWIRVPLLSSQI